MMSREYRTMGTEMRIPGNTLTTKVGTRQMANGDNAGVIRELAAMAPETIIDEAGLAQIFGRHPVSIKRAVRRGELPPGVKLFGRSAWTARAILDHLNRRLETVKQDRERLKRRISALGA